MPDGKRHWLSPEKFNALTIPSSERGKKIYIVHGVTAFLFIIADQIKIC